MSAGFVGPNGTERPDEHWNARLLRERAEAARCDAGACLVVHPVPSVIPGQPDTVSLHSTRRPEKRFTIDADEWQAHEAALERRGYDRALADLRSIADQSPGFHGTALRIAADILAKTADVERLLRSDGLRT